MMPSSVNSSRPRDANICASKLWFTQWFKSKIQISLFRKIIWKCRLPHRAIFVPVSMFWQPTLSHRGMVQMWCCRIRIFLRIIDRMTCYNQQLLRSLVMCDYRKERIGCNLALIVINIPVLVLCITMGLFHFLYFMGMVAIFPDSKVHEANMGPTWVLSAPHGPDVDPMILAIWVHTCTCMCVGVYRWLCWHVSLALIN